MSEDKDSARAAPEGDRPQKVPYAGLTGGASAPTARDPPGVAAPIAPREVSALLRYAVETGIDTEGQTVSALQQALTEYEQASAEDSLARHDTMVTRYAALAALTSPVNGRTLLDTQNANRHLFPLFFLTLVLLAVAVGNEILAGLLSGTNAPAGGGLLMLWTLQRHVLSHLSPFVWAGLGACVYLLKKLYDIAQERCFDSARLHGWFLRVILAAILGAVVLYLFDPVPISENGVPLDTKAIAFLVGLGVKVVYGALEKAVETFAEKLNLAAIRRSRAQTSDARTFLTQKATGKATLQDRERARVINELLNELGQQQSAQSER